MTERTYRIGTDIGGTFTDLVLLGSDGIYRVKKVLSTPPDYERGVIEGVETLLAEHGVAPGAVAEIAHATTVATNAVLERRGALTGLITTKGFRDVLEIRRLRFPDMYNLFWVKPKPLVDRYLRLEVAERMSAKGEILTALDGSEVETVVDRLVAEGIQSLAVALLNAYVNPAHEQVIGEIVRRRHPGLPVSLSSRVLPEMGEFERTSTTVINAYLTPVVRRYIGRLEEGLKAIGVKAPLTVMQSNGGMMSAGAAQSHPMHMLESGPAAGVVGAVDLVSRRALGDAVTFDMGGTTAKAAMIENGEPFLSAEYQVGAPISIASRVLKGGGYALRSPSIDIAEVGAGGGSIVSVDEGGALRVGPRSAGAKPGPACYGLGGREPTITDANLILGYLNPKALLGGGLALDRAAAEAAFAPVMKATGLALLDAAHGVYQIANATMMRAIRAVSSERGRDLRGCTLIVFGGNGALHAAEMARTLVISQALIPPVPGVFSAFGLLRARPERFFVESARVLFEAVDAAAVETIYRRLEAKALAEVKAEGVGVGDVDVHRLADLRYKGQAHELQLPAPAAITSAAIEALRESFHQEHKKVYGHAHDSDTVELVNARVRLRVRRVTGAVGERPVNATLSRAVKHGARVTRRAYFGPALGLIDTPVLTRDAMAGDVAGPFIIDEYDTTILVPPGFSATRDDLGNVVLALAAPGGRP